MSANTTVIEYTHFMNWLQNHCPALYTQCWAMIKPADNQYSLELNQPVTNEAVRKKLEQATGEYLVQLRND